MNYRNFLRDCRHSITPNLTTGPRLDEVPLAVMIQKFTLSAIALFVAIMALSAEPWMAELVP